MERKKASDFPQELLDLFDRYVHGEIHRREFLEGAQKFAVGGMTATALFEMLRPNYAWAIQVPESDNRIKAESATIPSPKGYGTITGYMARPADATETTHAYLEVPAVLMGGNHKEIMAWRLEQGLARTRERRPDLVFEDPPD